MNDATTYRGRDGANLTAQQVEQEFRKARIVAGKSTTGPEFSAALKEWKGTYSIVSAREKKATSASVMTLFICLGITAFIAVVSGFAGGAVRVHPCWCDRVVYVNGASRVRDAVQHAFRYTNARQAGKLFEQPETVVNSTLL